MDDGIKVGRAHFVGRLKAVRGSGGHPVMTRVGDAPARAWDVDGDGDVLARRAGARGTTCRSSTTLYWSPGSKL